MRRSRNMRAIPTTVFRRLRVDRCEIILSIGMNATSVYEMPRSRPFNHLDPNAVRLDNPPDWVFRPSFSAEDLPLSITYWNWIMSQQSEGNQSNSYYHQPQYATSMTTGQYSYPTPEGQSSATSNSNMSNAPPLNLPPIRMIDGQQQGQHPAPQQGAQPQVPSPMPPAIGQYYPGSQPYPPPSDPNAPMRYPIPPDGRVMSGGRHKKEIKRRTKTGCLTCRKRRIKVSKQHFPACAACAFKTLHHDTGFTTRDEVVVVFV